MPTRRERAQLQQQRTQQAQRSRTMVIALGLVALVVVAGLAVVGSGVLSPAASRPVAQAGPLAACSSEQSFPTQGQAHIRPNEPHPPYNSNPPTSGWHWDDEQEWGIYTTPQIQEQLVHNLEHGGIIIQYKDLPPEEVQRLTDLVNRDSHHVILAPYPGLPGDAKVALTAWNYLQTCDGVNEDVIRAFVNAHRDKGPERVP